MKRIKYLGVLLSIVTLCVACEKSEKDGLGGFHKNFVELRCKAWYKYPGRVRCGDSRGTHECLRPWRLFQTRRLG